MSGFSGGGSALGLDISTGEIQDNAVTGIKLATGSITDRHLNNSTIAGARLVSGAITDDKVNSLNASKITGSITQNQLSSLNGSILINGDITNRHFSNATMGGAMLVNGAVTDRCASGITATIGTGAITQNHLASNSVGSIQLIAGSVTTDDIGFLQGRFDVMGAITNIGGNFATTSTSYTDITGDTVSITTDRVCTIEAIAKYNCYHGTAGQNGDFQMLIDGIIADANETNFTTASVMFTGMMIGRITNAIVGLHTVQVQVKTGAGTLTVYDGAVAKNNLYVKGIEE